MNCLESMKALLSPLPMYSLAQNSLVMCELTSYYEGLKIVEQQLTELMREGFVQTGETYGVALWEDIIFSTGRDSTSLADRRSIILYTLSRMPGDFNLEGMLRGLKSIGLNCEITEIPAQQKVHIVTSDHIDALKSYSEVLNRVCSILPAHLDVELDIGQTPWNSLDARDDSFAAFEERNLTWDAFEIA